MKHFPLFADLQGLPCLIVGGGAVGARKAHTLLKAGAAITVNAPALNPELKELLAQQQISFHSGTFEPELLSRHQLVIAATDDRRINEQVAQAAARAQRFCNVVDDSELSSFIMPAIVDRSPVVIAVSSGGASPVLATRLRQQIDTLLPAKLGQLADFLSGWRVRVKARFDSVDERRHFWQDLLDGPIAGRVLSGDLQKAESETLAALDGTEPSRGFAYIVGAGPGDPELLTLKALHALQSADVVLHDRLIAPAVLELARRDAEFISVGKQAGQASITQEEINSLLVKHVSEGKRVCRLKGGDPFIFGRGGEEIDALNAAGLPWQVIPGITAAMGCAAAAGLPLTYRKVSRSLVLLTAHTDDEDEPDWTALSNSDQTLAIYMPVARIAAICNSLVAAGRPEDCPAAIIENGSTSQQRLIRGTLATLPALANDAGVKSPALAIIGDVVALASGSLQPASNELQTELWVKPASINRAGYGKTS